MKAIKFLIILPIVTLYAISAWAADLNRIRFLLPISSEKSSIEEMFIKGDIQRLINNPNKATDPNRTKGYYWKTKKEEPTISGWSLHYVTPYGFGLGYSSLSLSFKYELKLPAGSAPSSSGGADFPAQSWKFESEINTHFLDVSYTFGETITYTFGAGVLIDGKGKLTEKYKKDGYNAASDGVETSSGNVYGKENFQYTYDYETRLLNGQAIFFTLGYSFDFIEILARYHHTELEFGGFMYQQTLKYDNGSPVTYNDGATQIAWRQHSAVYKTTIKELQLGIGFVF